MNLYLIFILFLYLIVNGLNIYFYFILKKWYKIKPNIRNVMIAIIYIVGLFKYKLIKISNLNLTREYSNIRNKFSLYKYPF
jgi:hypothetical protein